MMPEMEGSEGEDNESPIGSEGPEKFLILSIWPGSVRGLVDRCSGTWG